MRRCDWSAGVRRAMGGSSFRTLAPTISRPWRSRPGTLWSYTIQRFRPKTPPYAGPEEFTPWALGYVDLPGEVIVQARLVNVAFADIRIGMPLALTKVALDAAADDPLWLPAFAPLEQAA
jgi:uncharacterized OB-fold protein